MDCEIKDTKGRTLSVHDMDPADELDLYEACADQSTNAAWLSMAMMACSVVAIDGTPVRFPTSKEMVKALTRQLGREGMNAVSEHWIKESAERKAAAASTTQADATVAKNS